MTFFRSTHLPIFLSLETLTSIIRTGLPILVELINLVNSAITFLSQMTLPRWYFRTSIPNSDSTALLDLFISSYASVSSTMAFPPMEILIMLLSQSPLTFQLIYKGMPHFIA